MVDIERIILRIFVALLNTFFADVVGVYDLVVFIAVELTLILGIPEIILLFKWPNYFINSLFIIFFVLFIFSMFYSAALKLMGGPIEYERKAKSNLIISSFLFSGYVLVYILYKAYTILIALITANNESFIKNNKPGIDLLSALILLTVFVYFAIKITIKALDKYNRIRKYRQTLSLRYIFSNTTYFVLILAIYYFYSYAMEYVLVFSH